MARSTNNLNVYKLSGCRKNIRYKILPTHKISTRAHSNNTVVEPNSILNHETWRTHAPFRCFYEQLRMGAVWIVSFFQVDHFKSNADFSSPADKKVTVHQPPGRRISDDHRRNDVLDGTCRSSMPAMKDVTRRSIRTSLGTVARGANVITAKGLSVCS